MMNFIRALGLAAAVALMPVAGSAAITISTSGTSAAPVENGIVSMSLNDVFAIEIEGSASDGAGSAAFGFQATSQLVAIETDSLNPNTGFAGATVEWNSQADGLGAVFGIVNAGAGATLITTFGINDTKWLIARWTDVTSNLSNFDLRVSAVPVPAAGLMLVTALGGAAALRRRKKAAAA